MDIQPQSEQPMSDDQELAKVLAGVSGSIDDTQAAAPAALPAMPNLSAPVTPEADLTATPPVVEEPVPEVPVFDPATIAAAVEAPAPVVEVPAAVSGSLDDVKKDALVALRPLVDKLQLEPQEKFDTYLLLIRSTDDKDLIGPAEEAAKAIPDETKKAQALLEIIKEIDYLAGKQAA